VTADFEALRAKVRPSHVAPPDADTHIERPQTPDSISPAAERALRSEEAARARGFGRTVIFLALGALTFLPFQPGLLWLKLTFAAILAVVIFISGLVWWRARNPALYTVALYRAYAVAALATCGILLYYGGVFGASPVVVTLGIYFFGQGNDGRVAVVLSSVAIVIYVVLAVLITIGVLPELGLFRGTNITRPAQIFATVMVPAVLIFTLSQARLSRQATRDAVTRLDEALRLVQQREALLHEARADLDQALAGGRGPWSGRQVGVYELAELIGRGASGEIYAATHAASAARVAVKILAPDAIGDEGMFERFRREADIARRLAVPNVVRVLDLGHAPGGTPFIAMELLEGQDLGWHLRRRPQMSLEEVVEMTEQVASGLEAAHAAGIVHRDLKPQNLFLSGGIWKILDFGVAKLRGSEGTLTKGAVVGTPGYMSPEQARGQEAETRSDLFSLGAVIYRALTGQPPFAGADLPESLFQIVYGMPERPGELVPNLSTDVDAVLAIALAKDSVDRFASAHELAQALRDASQGMLDVALRVRAMAIVGKLPWGTAAKPR
jgi:serine/threonine-protein kinase